MTRIIALSFLLCFFTLTATVSGASTEDPPGIILLMGDDHGWDETGYNGHPHLKTPVLDEMAANGLQLNRFYSAHPSCSPTRGSVMTGRHPNRYGTFSPNYSIRPEEITIAKMMALNGYYCGHIGKWHLGPVKKSSPTSPGAMGFHEWLSHDNFFELNPVMSRNGGPPGMIKGESSEICIEETIRFIQRSREQNKPFFAVVWFGSPHEPYSGLPDDLRLYDNLPQEYAARKVRVTSNETGRQTKRPLRDVLRERYAEITAMDRAIGQLRTWLGDNDLRDNTMLWYCGDNGTPGDGIVTSPLRGQKGTVYEGGVRVPGIIEWPARIKRGTVSDVNSVTSDILPTLCDMLNFGLPARELDGISIRPIIERRWKERPQPIFFWDYRGNTGAKNGPWIDEELQRGTTPLVKMMGDIRTRNFRNYRFNEIRPSDHAGSRTMLDNRFKLVMKGVGDAAKLELYDVRADPSESNDLATQHPAVVTQMRERLTGWQQSVLVSLTGHEYLEPAQQEE